MAVAAAVDIAVVTGVAFMAVAIVVVGRGVVTVVIAQ